MNTILPGDSPTFEDNRQPTPSFLLMLTSPSVQALLYGICVLKDIYQNLENDKMVVSLLDTF